MNMTLIATRQCRVYEVTLALVTKPVFLKLGPVDSWAFTVYAGFYFFFYLSFILRGGWGGI